MYLTKTLVAHNNYYSEESKTIITVINMLFTLFNAT